MRLNKIENSAVRPARIPPRKKIVIVRTRVIRVIIGVMRVMRVMSVIRILHVLR